jgi:hypothetical protein
MIYSAPVSKFNPVLVLHQAIIERSIYIFYLKIKAQKVKKYFFGREFKQI